MSPWRTPRLDRPKILVVRNDGLGDLVLTLPLVASLRRQLPHAQIFGLVSRRLAELVPLLPDFDGALLDEGVLLKRDRFRFPPDDRQARRTALLEALRAERFDIALLPYAEPGSAALVHQARIPVRVGSLRRAFFWRFNRFYTHSRHGSAKSEYELNLDYLPCLGLEPEFVFPALRVPADPPPLELPDRYAVLHPYKRSGTALTWPVERFAELARELAEAGLAVVVVGDESDSEVLHRHFAALAEVRIATKLSLPQLVSLIARARLFVGNSSGPLHLAGLTRTPHVGLYPRNRLAAPARWRTLPFPGAPAATGGYLLSPDLPIACVTCRGPSCRFHSCVAGIPLGPVRAALRTWGVT